MRKLNNIPNFKLIKNIFITLLDEDRTPSEVKLVADQIDRQILRAAWTVLVANASEKERIKLASTNGQEREGAVKQIMEEGAKNPKAIEELRELLNALLTDINAEMSLIT